MMSSFNKRNQLQVDSSDNNNKRKQPQVDSSDNHNSNGYDDTDNKENNQVNTNVKEKKRRRGKRQKTTNTTTSTNTTSVTSSSQVDTKKKASGTSAASPVDLMNSSIKYTNVVAFKINHPFKLNGQDVFTLSSKVKHKVLRELPLQKKLQPSLIGQHQQKQTYHRNHIVHNESICQINNPEHWIKDEVMHLMLQSLTRNYNQDEILTLNPSIFVQYLDEITEAGKDPDTAIKRVLKATYKQGLNTQLFNKKVIIIPLCERTHWNVFLIVNPFHTLRKSLEMFPKDLGKAGDGVGFGVFLCSLKDDDMYKEVTTFVPFWLNKEATRLKGDYDAIEVNGIQCALTSETPFNNDTFPVVNTNNMGDTIIPRQPSNNSWDCALYVLHYVWSSLRWLELKNWYRGLQRGDQLLPIPTSKDFDIDLFKFNQKDDISQLRLQLHYMMDAIKSKYAEQHSSSSTAPIDGSGALGNEKEQIKKESPTKKASATPIAPTNQAKSPSKDKDPSPSTSKALSTESPNHSLSNMPTQSCPVMDGNEGRNLLDDAVRNSNDISLDRIKEIKVQLLHLEETTKGNKNKPVILRSINELRREYIDKIGTLLESKTLDDVLELFSEYTAAIRYELTRLDKSRKREEKQGNQEKPKYQRILTSINKYLTMYVKAVGLGGLTRLQMRRFAGSEGGGSVANLPAEERDVVLDQVLKGVYCTSFATNKRSTDNIFDAVRQKPNFKTKLLERIECSKRNSNDRYENHQHLRKMSSCTENRCFFDSCVLATGLHGHLSMDHFHEARKEEFVRDVKEAERLGREPPKQPREYSLRLLPRALEISGKLFEVRNLMKKTRKNPIKCSSWTQLLEIPAILSVSVGLITDKEYNPRNSFTPPNIIGHGFMINGAAGYIQDGRFGAGYKIDEILYDDNGNKRTEDQVTYKIQTELKYFNIREVYQWVVLKTDVKAGNIPQFFGESNPRYCAICQESIFECTCKDQKKFDLRKSLLKRTKKPSEEEED